MKITRLSMKNPVGTALFATALAVLGIITVRGLPIAYWPNITPPFLIVQTPYPGVSPEDIEEEVTKPLERVVSTVSNIYEVESLSIEGMSQLTVRFDWGTDVNRAKIDLREKLDGARGELPRDIQPTSVLALDALIPAPLELAVTSKRYDEGELRRILEDRIVNRLLRLPNVAAIDIRGGGDKVVRVEANPEKMLNLGITLDQLTQVLGSENLNIPAGELTQGSRQFIVRSFNKFQSLDDIRSVVINLRGQTPILLGDIATVRFTDDDRVGIAYIDGQESLALSVRQTTDGNTVAMVDEVNSEMEGIRRSWPDLEFRVIKDDSAFIRSTIRSVSTNVLFGALVASLFIYLFLGSIRNTFIIVISIPVSILATFLVMGALGISLNTISLGGLALGVGMIVDSSIVVLENLFYRQRRLNGVSSMTLEAKTDLFDNAVSEVALPITASIATSVVVFLPLAFTKGLSYFLLGELSLTVVAALIFSLIVSFTVIPTLSLRVLKVDGGSHLLPRQWQKMIDWIAKIYRPVITALSSNWKRALLTMIAAFSLLVIPIAGIRLLDIEELPRIDEGQIRVNLKLPIGTSLDATSGIASDMEEKLMQIPEIYQVYSVVGLSAFYNQPISNIAWFDCRVPPSKGDLDAVMAKMRQALTGYPDAKIDVKVQNIGAGMGSSGIDVRVVGPNLDTLATISEEIQDSLRAYPSIINLTSNLDAGKPEVQVVVDRQKAAHWGFSTARVASLVRTAVDGVAVTKFSTADGNQYDVEVSLDRSAVRSLPDLRELSLQTPLGTVIPLRAVADFRMKPGPSEIRRSDQERFLAVTGDAAPGYRQRDVRAIAARVQQHITLPADYRWKQAGASRSIVESFQSLAIALVLAIFLVYVVMASQFNSFWQPIVISTAIPLALIGAVLGLILFKGALNVNSFLGIIMLSGIVVNNGILLIDFINRGRREDNMPRLEAIIQAGQRRLRPILMTTLTTMAGMMFIALGLGTGGETLVPLSAVVIGGLASSTLLTLLVVPAIYTLFDAFFTRIAGKKEMKA
ncbi:MAG: efflux RND transporter permease subunit [bacterium]